MKIMIIDDQVLFRNGLQAILSNHDDLNKIITLSNIDEGLLLNEKKPDLLLIDGRLIIKQSNLSLIEKCNLQKHFYSPFIKFNRICKK